MVLNIFPRREKPQTAASEEVEQPLPEPSAEALDGPDGADAKRPTRRGSRGGRGRRKPAGETTEVIAEEPLEAEAPASVAPRTRRPRQAPAATEPAAEAPSEQTAAPAARRAARKPAADASPVASSDLAALIKAVEAQ